MGRAAGGGGTAQDQMAAAGQAQFDAREEIAGVRADAQSTRDDLTSAHSARRASPRRGWLRGAFR
ncbi:hypothetical protein [Acrocarpospora sp. B8E8]|uniref:hypothetical protein n=1 Tax=Acrocarpospora sp. B8E8 TaxID=3153572 RepID=UPI00325F7654